MANGYLTSVSIFSLSPDRQVHEVQSYMGRLETSDKESVHCK